jgi:cation:H+ antiporter
LNIWLLFFLDAALIVVAGMQLTKNAEKISASLGLGHAWAGAILLPLATSLPELVTSLRAALINAPDLAGGNIYGSILFNLTLIALIDLAQGRGPLVARRKRTLILTALFSMLILIVSILGFVLALPYRLGWVGLDSIAILVVYLLGSGMIMGLESRRSRQAKGSVPVGRKKELYRSLSIFGLAAVVIILAGTNLTDTADLISMETGLGQTLVGTLFIAITTSLPELVTTMTAVRFGFVEMAIANVFGANFLNVFILFITDVFYRKGPLSIYFSSQNLIVAMMGVFLSLVVLISLLYPFRRQFLRMGITSYIIIGSYLFTVIYLFTAH